MTAEQTWISIPINDAGVWDLYVLDDHWFVARNVYAKHQLTLTEEQLQGLAATFDSDREETMIRLPYYARELPRIRNLIISDFPREGAADIIALILDPND